MFYKIVRVNNERDLYNNVSNRVGKISDVKVLAVNFCTSQNFSNSQFVSLKVKDAIVDKYRDNLE